MNICFISNFSKTYLFEAVSKLLQSNGINIFWIATNEKLYTHLAESFDKHNILLVNRTYIQKSNRITGEFKINELIYGDRVLRHTPHEGKKYLENIQRPIYDFIKKNNISKVYGEVTWSHEILIHRMCTTHKELDCQFLNPHVIRIPDRRFAFFTDERQSQILEFPEKENITWQKIVPKTPTYVNTNKKILKQASTIKGKLDRIKRFITNENIDPLDPTLLAENSKRLKQNVREELQREQYKYIKTCTFESCKDAPYVFLGLHKQPEASVDVLGRYYEDQLQNIMNLWRALPAGWNLLIKEHSIAIGDRSVNFYNKIKTLPNVHLVHEKTSSYEMIKNAELVATVSGTIAYEAALMGIPSVTFAPTFFNKLNTCRQITLEDLSKYTLKEIGHELKSQIKNISIFSKYIYQNSFEGNVVGPQSNPEVLDEDNIEIVSKAILDTLSITV